MIDLTHRQRDIIAGILVAHVPRAEVRAFGSRVTGKAKPYSDLDLAIVAATRLTPLELAELADVFAESELPFRVDILDWHSLTPEFQRIIEGCYEVVQPRPDE